MKKAANVSRTKQKVTQVFNQARESLKLLESLEKETLAKARSFIKIPLPTDHRRLTNERILASLKKLGVATHSEVTQLKARVEKLEAILENIDHDTIEAAASAAARKSSAEALPRT